MKSVRYLVVFSVLFGFLCVGTYLFFAPYAIIPFLSPIVMLILPWALAMFLYRRLNASWRVFGIGMLTFIGSQVPHTLFNNWTLLPILENLGLGLDLPPGSPQLAIFAIALGLSSGVFEETARYIVYSRWLEKVRSWKDGLMFGAGHAGIEAMVIGVLALLAFLLALSSRNGEISQLTPVQLDAYWNNPWYFHLLPLMERISAIIFHLSAALLVMQAFIRRNTAWYLAAILLHTLFNAAAVFALATWGGLVAEMSLLLISVISLWIIFALRTEEDETLIEYVPSSITPDNLKDAHDD